MRILVGSIYEGDHFQKVTMPCRKSHINYCEEHSYPFVFETQRLDNDRSVLWSKIKLIQKHWNNFDIFVWLDADTIITNNLIKIEDLVALMEDRDILIGQDKNGLNMGVFLLKNNSWTKMFLENVYRQDQFINHCWQEQMAVIHLYGSDEDVRKRFKVIHPDSISVMNAYTYNFDESSWLIHFAGRTDLFPLIEAYKGKANRTNTFDLSAVKFIEK